MKQTGPCYEAPGPAGQTIVKKAPLQVSVVASDPFDKHDSGYATRHCASK